MRMFCLLSLLPFVGCGYIPDHAHSAPKSVEADGTHYLACEGMILVYSPSKEVASASSKTYEIEFTDDYGKPVDLKLVGSYMITDAPSDAHYAMSDYANPANMTTAYSNGTPFTPGVIVLWGDKGSLGRAKWKGPGEWLPVPCQ